MYRIEYSISYKFKKKKRKEEMLKHVHGGT